MKTKFITKNKLIHSLVVLFCVFTLTACGSGFDAAEYTESCLDAMTKGEFGTYTELTQISESSAQTSYQNRIRSDANSLISSLLPDSATKDEFYSIFKDLYAKCKYEVGEATKNDDDSYSVPITAYKMNVFHNLLEETSKKSEKKAKEKGNVSSSDVSKIYLETLAEVLKDHLENVEYAEPTTITVSVTPTQSDSKVYTISDSEYVKIFQALMDVENLQADASSEE